MKLEGVFILEKKKTFEMSKRVKKGVHVSIHEMV